MKEKSTLKRGIINRDVEEASVILSEIAKWGSKDYYRLFIAISHALNVNNIKVAIKTHLKTVK